ncbi:hypothetical protein U1Q18_052482 [Sarracenia purpurea var. burkii]
MASNSVVGFFGLDEVSLELAASLLRSGYGAQAFEACSPLLDEFAKQGGIKCVSPIEAVKDVVALVILKSHPDQINDLLFGHGSALKGLRKDVVIFLHSSILPVHIQKLEKLLTEYRERVFIVDIYAFRGMSEVSNGKIMMIASGGGDSITRARPILSAMCEKLFVFEGEHGAGSKIKMVTELLEGIHFVASVEAISLGIQAGVHPWIVYDIISNAAGNSWVFKNHVPQLLGGNQTKHLLNAFVQNLGNILDMARSCMFPLPLLAVAHQQLIAGFSDSHGNDDAKLIKVWEEVYGVNITAAANAETYSPEKLGDQMTAETNSVSRIGFIGLGAMGFGMATHLLRSNFCVIGYDVTHPSIHPISIYCMKMEFEILK